MFRMIAGLSDEIISGYLERLDESQYDTWENEEFEDFMEYIMLDIKYSDKLNYFDS